MEHMPVNHGKHAEDSRNSPRRKKVFSLG